MTDGGPIPAFWRTAANRAFPYLYRSSFLRCSCVQFEYSSVRKHDVRPCPVEDSYRFLLGAS